MRAPCRVWNGFLEPIIRPSAPLSTSWGHSNTSRADYAEAEPLLRRALAIREAAVGSESPDVAGTLNNLAAVCRAQGRRGEAEVLYRRTLDIYHKTLGPQHPSTAIVLSNLGDLYYDRRQYAEAESAYRRALTIQEKVLGLSHPQVANSLDNSPRSP